MRVVTTRTMTITVSSTLDKPTKGSTLERKLRWIQSKKILNLPISFSDPSSAVVTGRVSRSRGSPVLGEEKKRSFQFQS